MATAEKTRPRGAGARGQTADQGFAEGHPVMNIERMSVGKLIRGRIRAQEAGKAGEESGNSPVGAVEIAVPAGGPAEIAAEGGISEADLAQLPPEVQERVAQIAQEHGQLRQQSDAWQPLLDQLHGLGFHNAHALQGAMEDMQRQTHWNTVRAHLNQQVDSGYVDQATADLQFQNAYLQTEMQRMNAHLQALQARTAVDMALARYPVIAERGAGEMLAMLVQAGQPADRAAAAIAAMLRTQDAVQQTNRVARGQAPDRRSAPVAGGRDQDPAAGIQASATRPGVMGRRSGDWRDNIKTPYRALLNLRK